jgi:anti-sigma factor RsiW
MTCRKTQYLIQTVVDGAATRPEREAVGAHVARCAECARALAESRQLVSMLAGAPRRRVSEAFDQELMASVRGVRPVSLRAAWWERFRLRFEWRLRLPAMVTAGSLAAAVVAAIAVPQVRQAPQRRERGEYIARAVERHQQIERGVRLNQDVNWDALDASIELSTGTVVTE